MRSITTVILGGGQGTRLRPLTSERAKPAVPVGGKYRLIDISISNCINSGLRRIFVLTQFMSASLHKHIQQTFRFDTFSEGFVHILAAQETPQSMDWFHGTADAVRRIQKHIAVMRPERVLVLPGDHICRLDFRDLIRHHEAANADATIGVVPVGGCDAAKMGIVSVDAAGRVTRFVEKPEDLEPLRGGQTRASFLAGHGIEGNGEYLGSMGVYLFESVALATMLAEAEKADFGSDIRPEAVKSFRVSAYPFGGYWRDVGTIGAFYEANIELTEAEPPFSFHEPGAEVFTRSRHLPLAKVTDSRLDRSLIAEGSEITGAEVVRSVVGIRTKIGPGTVVRDSILLGTDFYEPSGEVAAYVHRGLPPIGVGENCRIERAIIDKNARIGEGVVIADKTGRPDFEAPNYWIRDGIVVIPKGGVLRAGTKV